MGLWLLNRMTQELAIADLLEAAATLPPFTSLINPKDERFINFPSMVASIRQACRERQQAVPQEAAGLVEASMLGNVGCQLMAPKEVGDVAPWRWI